MSWLKRRIPVLGAAVLVVAYTTLVEPAWVEVTRLAMPGAQDRKLRLVQLSDLHLASLGSTTERVLAAMAEIAPDVILLTGDIVDRPDTLPVLDAFLSRLPRATKAAVPGNWEYWGGVDPAGLREIYARHGVRLLINECVRLTTDNGAVRVAGLDDFTAGRPDAGRLDPACLGNGDDLILVQHSPGFFEMERPRAGFPRPLLALSGHTHGGQVSLFGHAFWTPPGSGSFNRGWYDTAWGKLYVSRGVGTSVARVRFASRPEVAVFEWRP